MKLLCTKHLCCVLPQGYKFLNTAYVRQLQDMPLFNLTITVKFNKQDGASAMLQSYT